MKNLDNFKQLLLDHHEWPTHYNFKFVVLTEKKSELISLLETHTIQERFSANQKYISITSTKLVESPDEVVAVYQSVSTIEGIMTL